MAGKRVRFQDNDLNTYVSIPSRDFSDDDEAPNQLQRVVLKRRSALPSAPRSSTIGLPQAGDEKGEEETGPSTLQKNSLPGKTSGNPVRPLAKSDSFAWYDALRPQLLVMVLPLIWKFLVALCVILGLIGYWLAQQEGHLTEFFWLISSGAVWLTAFCFVSRPEDRSKRSQADAVPMKPSRTSARALRAGVMPSGSVRWHMVD
mmetsp:Transcript_150860/g.261412  ORF Transcript_150860/g.261412 Transcript_150860/m.261412 type:complete len:203 (+) Transcript_150860:2-610(+)